LAKPRLPAVYEELSGRARSHLKKIRAIPKKHPEYTVALIIAVVSEGLSRLRGEPNYSVFKRLLARREQVGDLVARGLFRAVRHGLAHRYDTSMIDVGSGQSIVVIITWKKPHKHLLVESGDWLGDGVKRLGLWLDMETLWTDLRGYLKKMDDSLRANRQFSRSVVRRGLKLDRKYTVRANPEKGEDPKAWREAWETFIRERS
jgi:hypothetical protein